MIRIARGTEPEELKRIRRRQLARAYLAFLDGAPIQFEGYQAVKKALFERQYEKCAYCERDTGFGSQPVEHFRPKDGALRNLPKKPDDLSKEPKIWDEERYWWLAWSWENLLFACETCNGQSSKGNYFPLESGTNPLPAPPRELISKLPLECFELYRESTLLIDPAREDPLLHIRWWPINAGKDVPEEMLGWWPMDRTARGDVTRRLLGMLGELTSHVSKHIRKNILRPIRALRRHMAENRADLVRSEWDALTAEFVTDRAACYAAASYDALDYFVPLSRRKQWGLYLPRPGSFEDPAPSSDLPDPEGFEHLPIRLQWRIRAEEPIENLIVDVCRVRDWTIDELAVLLNRASGTIDGYVRSMIHDGRLLEIPATQPKRLRAPQI